MASMRKKSDLPSKICATCGRPFTWRKKWRDCWDDVRYYSKRCGRDRRREQSNSAADTENASASGH